MIHSSASSTERTLPVKLLDDDSLERSAIVAKCRMNREWSLLGSNGYDRELGFNPLDFFKERATADDTVARLDICCGTGRALIQGAEIVHRPKGEPSTLWG
jgi:hypothetical protein